MRHLFLRGILAFLILGLVPAMLPASPRPAPADPDSLPLHLRIEQLKKRALKPLAPDSLKYALARLCTNSPSIDDRVIALFLFNDLRVAHAAEPRFHWDHAMAYESCQEPSRARRCLEEMVERDSTNVEAYVEIARLRLAELLYHFDLAHTGRMMEALRKALTLDPQHRDALFLASLTLEMAAGLADRTNPALTREGVGYLQRILARAPGDVPARLLLAVHLVDLGQIEAAAGEFTTGLAASPDSVRRAFVSLQWTAPQAALTNVAKMDSATRERFDEAYWDYKDPTPLTLLNENQLEIWKRLVLSDFLFGRPDRHRRGWETPAGQVFIRYGRPNSYSFDPGALTSYASIDETPPVAGMHGGSIAQSRSPLLLAPPSWNWDYRFRGLKFSIRLDDMNLNGDFMLDNPSRMNLTGLRQTVPVVFDEAPPGRIRHLYLVSAGVAGTEGRVRQSVQLGVPLWRPVKDQQWLRKVTVELVVRDSTRQVVRRRPHTAIPADLGAVNLPGRLDLLLIQDTYDLSPGRYTVSAFVEDSDRKYQGSFSTSMTVRDYRQPGLTISDLKLALDPDPALPAPRMDLLDQPAVPDPLCLVGADKHLNIFYEVYGLAEQDGLSLHQARYTVLPREYVLEYERLVREGKLQANEIVSFAAQIGARGDELGAHNYSDVIFPPSTLRVENARVPKGTRLSVADLEPGEYAMIVTITDLRSDVTTSARTWFRVLTDAQREELLKETQGAVAPAGK